MHYYVVLSIALSTILGLTWAIWKQTKNVAFLFGIAVMYYWTLHGGWSIVLDELGGDSHMNYHYLFDKVFRVYLDEHYTWTLLLYALFVVLVQLTALVSLKPQLRVVKPLQPVLISHGRIIAVCSLATILSFWIIHQSLGSAMSAGASGYVSTRSTAEDVAGFRIHQVLNRVALGPSAIGFAVLMSSGGYRYVMGERRLQYFLGYTGLLAFMFCFCVVLGNKNELAFSLFAGCLFYFCNSLKPKTWQLGSIGLVLLAGVGFIDYARTFSIDEIASNFSIAELAKSLGRLTDSNEGFAAHISLYGVMACELPLTYGSSIVSFLASAVPRELWPDRPPDIYTYYAEGVGAIDGQGYTIHHATGWYLNFGVIGIVIGACILGRLWAWLYNNVAKGATEDSSTLLRMFYLVCFFTFSASFPTLIRTGPEGYKGVFIESLALPAVVLAFARIPQMQGAASTRATLKPARIAMLR